MMLLLLAACISFITAIGAEVTTPREQADQRDNLWFHFVTRPDLQPPKFNVTIYDEQKLSPGYWFVSPYEDADKEDRGMPWVGPYIYDDHGDLIWAGTPLMDHFKLWDFKVSEFTGNPVLSGLWQRDYVGVLINNHYEIIKRVPIELWNMHEFNIVDNGKRVLVATKKERYELSVEMSNTIGFDGRCKVTADGFQDIDLTVEPAKVDFEWGGIDHMPLTEAVNRPMKIDHLCSHNWDIHHFNAIDLLPDGDYLISSRHTSTIYKVSYKDGSIVWRLGGQKSDFKLPAEAQFTRQHDVRFIEQNSTHMLISFLDNAYGWTDETRQDPSRGLVLALLTNEKRVEVVQQAQSPIHSISQSRGSTQRLPNGNLFVCWVDQTRLSEHGPDGELLMHSVAHAGFEAHVDSYRAYKLPWVGQPLYSPDVASAAFIAGNDKVTIVHVSWNGATEVSKWRLYESNADGNELKRLKQKPREGFETRIMYHEQIKYVVVEGLDNDDQPLGRSKVVRTIPPVQEADSEDNWFVSAATNPMSMFVAGFLASAIISLAIWFAFPSSRWQRSSQGGKYEAVEGEDQEDQETLYEIGDGEVDEDIVPISKT